MSDRLPGSCWSNPIWYGRYRICIGEPDLHPSLAYAFSHDDYDGADDANDNRSGHAPTIEAAKAEIDAIEQERETYGSQIQTAASSEISPAACQRSGGGGVAQGNAGNPD